MTYKSTAAPIDPKTELTREDIATMAGVNVSKVQCVTSLDKWGFPKPIRIGQRGKKLFNRAAVKKWLKKNDLKTMVFTIQDRLPIKTIKKPDTGIDSTEVRSLQICINPPKFNGHGKTVTVHVPERNEYEVPHPMITKFSNSGAEHRFHAM